MYLKREFRFQIILHDLARSLATVNDAPWEKVKILYSYCPQVDDGGHFVIEMYSLDSVIALGTYFIRSGYKHADRIIPYLMNLLDGLITAKWFPEFQVSEVPFAEKFSFCLNILLTEVSIFVNKDIFLFQINLFENIITSLVSMLSNGFVNEEERLYFFSIKLPVFLGLAQSMSRYTSNTNSSYFCYLFSKEKAYIGIFHHIKAHYDCPHVNLFSAVCEEANKTVRNSCLHIFNRQFCSYSYKNIVTFMEMLRWFLSEEVSLLFEKNINEFKNQSCLISPFYLNNLYEILKCASMLLYREIFYQSSDLTEEFLEENKEFLDRIYSSVTGNEALQYFHYNETENELQTYQKLKVNVLTKVICLEVLSWSVRDVHEAEALSLHVTPLLMSKQNDKILILNTPYVIACLDVLGTLAENFKTVCDIFIKPLQNFLSSPSPVIIDLYKNSHFSYVDDFILKNNNTLKSRWFEYCIFKKVQNSAIENICKSLKSASTVNSDYIPAFLTKFSSLLFMERSHSEYSLVIGNVVVTLGHISYSMPSLSMTILQCFQQRLCRHSIESDIAIIHQLGNMLILNRNMEVFFGALKTFSKILLEVINDSNKELTHISDHLFHVLQNVADRLQEQLKILPVFIRFLEIFVQTGLDELRSSEISTTEGNQSFKSNRVNLLHAIALLGEKLESNTSQFKKQQERLFQDLLLYLLLSQESLILENDFSPYIKNFVPKLPTLTSESLTDHDLREFFYMSSLNRIKVSIAKQNQLKTHILNFLQNSSEISVILNRLSFPQIIYLHSVCALEIIRIQNSEEPSFEFFLNYLTNLKLQKDKYGMWQCICKVAEEIFRKFLIVLVSKKRDARDCLLEKNAKLLLIHFNNVNSQIRHIADKCLSELIDSFPHLLWNRQVLWTILDVVTVLYYSETIDSCDQITELKVPKTDYSIFLMDTNKSRKEILDDFVARSRDIISEARKWQPAIVNSHLQEYLLQEKHSVTYDNPLFDLRYFAWNCLCSNEKSQSISEMISSLALRSRYIGEICGLIEASNMSSTDYGQYLVKEIKKSCREKDTMRYKIWFYRAAAFVVTQPVFQYELKQTLASSHLYLFTDDVMQTVIECWNWICAYNPRFEIELLLEILEAWRYSINFRIGTFSDLNHNEGKLNSNVDQESHNIWSEFISKQIYSSIYGCQDKLEIVVSFLNNTLPICIGSPDCVMSKSIESIPCRFSILSSALTLVQSNSMAYIDRVIIRQRIYCSCLDYFCSLQDFPRKNGTRLKQTIEILVKFWHILYSDKLHILKYENVRILNEHFASYVTSDNGTLLNHFKSTTVEDDILLRTFTGDFLRKRRLCLCLLAKEIEFLTVYNDPSNRAEKIFTNEECKIQQWKTNFFSSHRSMSDFIKNTWKISPILTVYLPIRIKQHKNIFEEISRIILQNPCDVSHVPHAMLLLASVENVKKDCKELVHLLTWSDAQPLEAISLLSKDLPPHPFVLQYAVKTLLNCRISVISQFIPQLVQAIRYDSLGYVNKLLLLLSDKSQLFCHQLVWNIKSNMYLDANMLSKSSLYEKLTELLNCVISQHSEIEQIFFKREFDFVNQITEVSSKIPKNLRSDEKKNACRTALQCIKIKPGCYLPSNPEAIIYDVDYQSGTPLQSKCRTPYLAKFLVCELSYDEVHNIGMAVSQSQLSGILNENSEKPKPQHPLKWQRAIFKAGDDVRQDILAIQTIKLLKKICNDLGLDVFLFPYNVVAIAPHMGVIECIPNAYSRDELGKQTNVGLYDYFITTFGNEKSVRFHEAQRNFIKSVAAYSIVSFLLQTKDRHNGNIMVDKEGHIIHIDFGFMFESSPGGNLGFEPDMKLTEEMVMIMGGKMDAEPFQWFIELCVKTYLISRNYQEQFITLVNLMLDSGLPCFRGHTIKLLRERFAPQASEREAANYIITVIRNSFLNFRTVTYDMLQYLQNSIQY